MELKVSLPDREGQICKIRTPMEDEDPAEVYIVAEDPGPYTDDENIYVVGLKELQRNIRTPESASRIPCM